MKSLKYSIFFIINPIAGNHKNKNIISEIESIIDQNHFKTHILISERPGHVSKLADDAVEKGADIIVAVGGDGTVNEIASKITHTPIILGIIPTGSGNGLAHYFKIPTDYKKSLEIINRMNVQHIDTGTINGHFFVSVAGIGFDATVAKEYQESGKRGFKTYLTSGVKKYFSYKPKKFKIRIGDHVISRKALFITFANSDQYGYNVSIAPNALIDDGLFDMCIMKKVPLKSAPVVIPKLLTHKIHTSKFHELIRIEEATVFRNSNSVIHVDGEAVKIKSKILHVKNHRHSLKIIVSD